MKADPFTYGLLSPTTTQKYANIENYEGFGKQSPTITRRDGRSPVSPLIDNWKRQNTVSRRHTPRNKDGTPKEKPERISKLVDLFFADYFVSSYEDSDIDEVPKLKRQIEEYKSRETKYAQEIDTLIIQNNDLTTQLETIHDKDYDSIATLERRIDDLTRENTNIRDEMAALATELAALRASSKASSQREEEHIRKIEELHQQLQHQLQKQREHSDTLTKQFNDKLNEQTANSRMEVTRLTEQNIRLSTALERERMAVAEKLAATETEKGRLREQYEQVVKQLESTQDFYNQQMKTLEEERNNLLNELRSSKSDLQSSVMEVNNLKRRSIAMSMPVPNREMTIALNNKEEEIRRLTSEIAALEERHQMTIKEIQTVHELMATDLAEKDRLIAQSKAEISGLSTQLERHLKIKLELESRISFLERSIKDKDGAMDLIQERIDTAQKAMALSSGQHSMDLSQLRSQINAKNCEIARLQDEIQAIMQSKTAEINTLKLNVATLTERVREYRTRLLEVESNASASKTNSGALLHRDPERETSSTQDSVEYDLNMLEKELSIKTILLKKKDDDIDFFRSQLVMREAEIERLLASQTASCTNSKRAKTPLKAALKKSKS